MPDIEEQLRRYGDLVESLVPDVDLPAERSSAERSSAERSAVGRRPLLAAAAAIVVVAACAAAVVTFAADDQDQLATASEDPVDVVPDWQWRPIAEGPLEPTTNAVSVWTGEEMLVFGGSATQVSTAEDADGLMGDTPIRTDSSTGAAAYDPTTDSWRVLAALPQGVGGGEAVWTGDEAIVITPADVLSYDPAADAWSVVPLPLPAESYGLWDTAVGWTGSEVLIWGYQHRRFDQPGFLFGFDPEDGTFEELDVGPLDYRWGASSSFSGSGLTVVGGSGNTTSMDAPALDAATFDVEAAKWSAFEPGPLPDVGGPWVVEADGELVVFGGATAEASNDRAVALSPTTGRWRVVADGGVPGGFTTSGVTAWTGDEVVMVDSPSVWPRESPGPSSGALDPATGAWRPLPDVPGGAACGSTGVWTGRELIVWGGSVGCTETLTPRANGYRMAVGEVPPPGQDGPGPEED